MSNFYQKSTPVSTGSVLGPNKGILLSNTTGAAISVALYTYSQSGGTASMVIDVPANDMTIVPVEIHTYVSGATGYKLN